MRNEMNVLVAELEKKVEEGIKVMPSEKKLLNGGVQSKVTITTPFGNVSPCITVDDYLDRIAEGEDLDSICQEIFEIHEKAMRDMPASFDVSQCLDKNYIIENVVAQIVNAEKNEEMLEGVLNRRIMDLAIIYRIEVGNDGTIVLSNQIAEMAKVTLEEIDEAAFSNMEDSYLVQTMASVMAEMTGMDEEMAEAMSGGPTMYVVTNKKKVNGAVAMMNTRIFTELAEKEDQDLLIIPSSIHELLVVGVNSMSVDDVRTMVAEVNDTQVQPSERLSYNVYIYNRADEVISIA